MEILIAEDHYFTAKLLSNRLSKFPDIHVKAVAQNGREVMSELQEKDFDVILLDLKMPLMDGFGVLNHLTKMGRQEKVLVLSCCDDENSICRAVDCGASGYITKNATIDEVAKAVAIVGSGKRCFDCVSRQYTNCSDSILLN